MDLIKARLKPSMTDKSVSSLTKVLCVIFVIGSYVVANTDTPILDMMSYSWGIISRLLPRAVCGGAVLEEDEPLRRMGRYVERISHRAGSRRQQASIARRRISAYCCKARGAWPCVRGSCNDCIASTLLCCQRH